MAKGKCAFCNYHGKLTGEHVWPEWLQTLLPLELHDSHHFHLIIKPQSLFEHRNSIINRQRRSGDPGSRKLPTVCADCNNGWMSRLQERAKDHLIPIVQGQWTDLSNFSDLVAKWCVMTTMVYEYLDTTTIAISQEERDQLRLGGALSDSWTVWIGRCPAESPNRRAAHRAYRVIEGPMTLGKPNSQVTTLHVGQMLAQVVFAPFNDHDSNVLYALQSGMKLLHPTPSRSLDIGPPLLTEQLIEPHQARLIGFFEDYARGVRTVLMPGIPY